MGATSSPRGLQPFEAQSDHRCPTEHSAQVQGLHAFGHIERHTGQNVLSERERGVSGRARPWFGPASSYKGPVRMPEQPSACPHTPPSVGPWHTHRQRWGVRAAFWLKPRDPVTSHPPCRGLQVRLVRPLWKPWARALTAEHPAGPLPANDPFPFIFLNYERFQTYRKG